MSERSSLYEYFTNKLPIDNSKKIYFEKISLNSIEEMHNYSVDIRLYEYLEYSPFKSLEDTKSYLLKLLNRMKIKNGEANSNYWFVRASKTKTLIGTACLINLNFDRQSIEWGYGIDPKLWGKGYILKIQEALKCYVFETLRLNRLYGTTFITNKRTINSLLASGMQYEGKLKDMYCKKGEFIDGWAYAMLKKDYMISKSSISKNGRKEIEEIIRVISTVLKEIKINEESSMENIIEWDSINHMAIILKINEEFEIQLKPKDIAEATSVSKIYKIINRGKID